MLAWLAGSALVAGCVGGAPSSRSGPQRPLASLPRPDEAGPQELWAVGDDAQTLTSRWYLALDGAPIELSLTSDLDGRNATGTATGDDGVDPVDEVTWDATTGVLDFRRRMASGVAQWVHARAVEGVVTGRAGYGMLDQAPPADVAAYTSHVVGWNDHYFSRDLVPRVFDLTVDGRSARLRLDRDGAGAIVGRYKVYADDVSGVDAEEVESDVDVQAWDGRTLRFVRATAAATQSFDAIVDGRTLLGTMSASTATAQVPFDGVRAELLAYGFVARDGATRDDWQQRARRQLAHLMMADNPAPLSLSVDRQPADAASDDDGFAPDRDDDAADWPAAYSVDELQLSATLPSPYGGTLSRAMHGYLTTPASDAPTGGWPAMIVLNGHQGSAHGTLDPSDPLYWYGDAWARRGWVVLALDVGHRPLADRAALYRDYVDGDRPDDGNGTHPAIRAAALDSDWVEDGERTWDVERAVDYLRTLGTVDGTRILVSGLSMGGEVASFAAALDARVAAVVPAGFVPDLTVMAGHGNHPCWSWLSGDPLDYYSVSDLHALVAPRPLLVETGLVDDTFSSYTPPFVDGKEVARRSRAAFADAPARFALYLHPDGHAYRFGDATPDGAPAVYVTVPAIDAPSAPGDVAWAADGSTISLGLTVADWLAP